MNEQRQDDQLQPTHSSSMSIRYVNLENLPEAMDDREGWRYGSSISMLMARHDDDDDDDDVCF